MRHVIKSVTVLTEDNVMIVYTGAGVCREVSTYAEVEGDDKSVKKVGVKYIGIAMDIDSSEVGPQADALAVFEAHTEVLGP